VPGADVDGRRDARVSPSDCRFEKTAAADHTGRKRLKMMRRLVQEAIGSMSALLRHPIASQEIHIFKPAEIVLPMVPTWGGRLRLMAID